MRDVSEDCPGDRETWMSYAEASQALGIDIGSVKKRARRRGWRRQAGNDGTTRVAVPRDALGDVLGEVPADGSRYRSTDLAVPSSGTSLLTGTAVPALRGQIAALENHIATLREQLVEARQRAANAAERADNTLDDLRTERMSAAEDQRRSADRITELEGEIRAERAGWRTQVDGLQAEVRRFASLLGAGAEEHRHLVKETARLLAATQNLLRDGPPSHPPEGTLRIEEIAELQAELDQDRRQPSSDAPAAAPDLLTERALAPVLAPDSEERIRSFECVIEPSAELPSSEETGTDTSITPASEPVSERQIAAPQVSLPESVLPWFQRFFRRRRT